MAGERATAVTRIFGIGDRNDELFRQLIDAAPDAMVIVDTRGVIVLVNAQTERLFGYPKVPLSQLIGWVADWISREQRLLGKPTKFESRDGKY